MSEVRATVMTAIENGSRTQSTRDKDRHMDTEQQPYRTGDLHTQAGGGTGTITIDVEGKITVTSTATVNLEFLQNRFATADDGRVFVEALDLTENITVWVDEEGLLKQQIPNYHGTKLVTEIIAEHGNKLMRPLVGTVVFTGGVDANGNTMPLTEEQVTALIDRL